MRRTGLSSALSTITAVTCFISLMAFREVPLASGELFAIHALVFMTLGAVWFHVFGRPALAGWFGYASQRTLAREQAMFQSERRDREVG